MKTRILDTYPSRQTGASRHHASPRQHPQQPGFRHFYRNTLLRFDVSYSLKQNDLVVVSFDLDDRHGTFVMEGIDDQLTPEEREELNEIEKLHFGSKYAH